VLTCGMIVLVLILSALCLLVSTDASQASE
jgi:hypothetical protein